MSDDDEGAPPTGLKVHTFGPTGDSPKGGWDESLQPKAVDPSTILAASGVGPDDIAAAATGGKYDMMNGGSRAGASRFAPGPVTMPADVDAAEARATRLKCLDLATQAVGAKDLTRLMEAARQLVAFVNDG